MVTIDPLLREFLPVLGAVFGIAIALIGVAAVPLRRRKPSLLSEIWRRYLVWLVIAALLVGALVLGRGAWIAGVTVLSLAVFREYARGVGLWMDVAYQGVVYLFILLIGLAAYWPWPPAPGHEPLEGWYTLFVVMPVYGTLYILATPVFRGQYEHMLQKSALALLALIYFGWCLGHFAYMVNVAPVGQANGVGMILFLTTLVALNDVGAFVVGKLAGRHKLAPSLSPGKTWEGAVGAFLLVLGTAWLLRWLVPFFPTPHLLVAAALISVGGVFGDLSLSVVKRDLGIKDWGTTLPGHGGLLDRANSLIFAAPIFFHYALYLFVR